MPPDVRLDVLQAGTFDDRLRDPALVRTLVAEAEIEAEREQRLEEARALADATAAVEALEDGRTPPDLTATRLRLEKLDSDAARTALADLNEAAEDAPELRAFGLKPLAEQRARIDELTASPDLTPRQQRRLGRLRRAHGRLVKGLETAPFQTVLERGLIDAVAPLDFDNPESLAARAAQAEVIAAAYGMAVSPLRPAEARALEARLDGTAADALPDALAGLRAGFGDAAMAEVARGLETARPHLAVALRRAKDNPDLAADILEGGRLLKQAVADGKSDSLRPTEAELRAASARVYGSETAHLDRPAEAEAAAALYALRTADTTKPGFQPAVFDQALRDVAPVGAVVDDFGMLGVPAPSFLNVPTHAGLPEAAPFIEVPRAIQSGTRQGAERAQADDEARRQAAEANQPLDGSAVDGEVLFDIPSTPEEDLRQFLLRDGVHPFTVERTLQDPKKVEKLLNSPAFLDRERRIPPARAALMPNAAVADLGQKLKTREISKAEFDARMARLGNRDARLQAIADAEQDARIQFIAGAIADPINGGVKLIGLGMDIAGLDRNVVPGPFHGVLGTQIGNMIKPGMFTIEEVEGFISIEISREDLRELEKLLTVDPPKTPLGAAGRVAGGIFTGMLVSAGLGAAFGTTAAIGIEAVAAGANTFGEALRTILKERGANINDPESIRQTLGENPGEIIALASAEGVEAMAVSLLTQHTANMIDLRKFVPGDIRLEKEALADFLNEAFREAAEGQLEDINKVIVLALTTKRGDPTRPDLPPVPM